MTFPSRNKYLPAILLLLLWAILPSMTFAQENAPNVTSLAREEQNPISTMTQLGLRYSSFTGAGINGDQTPSQLNLHISMPYKWNENWNIITQADMPFTSWRYGAYNYSGAGNLLMQMYFSPRKNNKSLMWGIGPAVQFPTATNHVFDNGQYAAGPTVAVVRNQGRWVNALQANHLWKVGGSSDSPAMNSTFIQLALNYNLKNGWAVSLGSGAVIDWTIQQGEKSIVPVGWSIGRTIIPRRGGNPISWNIGTSYNVVRPVGAPQMQYKFQLTFLFPQRTVDSSK